MKLRTLAFGAALALWAAPAAAQQTIDIAVFHTERDAFGEPMRWWMAEVEKRSAGRIKFKAHYSGALVKITEALNATKNGVVPMAIVAPSFVSGQIPAMAYLEVIGGFPSKPEDNEKALAQLKPEMERLFRAQGVEFLFQVPSFGGAVVCREKHLKSPADWKGLKVRTAGRYQAQQIQALGGSPAAIDPAEQYIALQNKTVDCALTVNNLGLALKLHEVAPKVTQLRLPGNSLIYIMNARVWAALPEADRTLLKTVGREAEIRGIKMIWDVQAAAVATMKAQKADVAELTDAELKAFREAVKPVFEAIDKASGDSGKAIGAIVRSYW